MKDLSRNNGNGCRGREGALVRPLLGLLGCVIVLVLSMTAVAAPQNATAPGLSPSAGALSSASQMPAAAPATPPAPTAAPTGSPVVMDDTRTMPQASVPKSTQQPAPSNPTRNVELTDFQKMVATSTGQVLTIYGTNLFENVPSTFAPVDHIPVTADYVIGPGRRTHDPGMGPD